MILVSVLYPNEQGSRFDSEYYLRTHIPLVKERWEAMGLKEVRLVRGAATPDGSPPPYQVMALLTFDSLEAFQKAAAASGAEIFADIPNFTSVQPVVQINEAL